MEKQRAFSFKPLIGRLPTRFLVFSFTISFSLLFLTFFPIWVIRVTPSVRQETHFQFNKPSISLGLEEPLTVPTFSSSSRKYSGSEVRNAILIGTHFEIPADTSEIHKVPEDETNKIDGVNSNLTGLGATSSVTGVNNSILMDTPVKGPEITYGFAKDSVFWGRLIKKGGSEVQDDDIQPVEAITGNSTSTEQHIFHTSFRSVEVSVSVKEKSERVCDVTKGRWVFDESYPLYRNVSCPFIDEGFNCEANGRLDKDYMKWRWQPQDCDIPRFNATKMLDLIRGKRLVFVGDSINRNQWESMLCLLMGAIKDPKRVYESRGRRITKEKGNYCFKFVDYKCTIEYYVTHFLVHESKARVGKKRVQTLRIDTMDRGSSRWKGADILVFNTAHWWTHYKTKSGINYYQEGDQVLPRLDVSTAFQKALITWAAWVDKHINPGKTQVFFRSSAPSHFRGGQWNAGGHCKEASRPINGTSNINYPEKNIIAEEVIRQMKTPVTFLNVTSLSDYRIDGHPSIYGRRSGKSYSSDGQDCSHWCLPGVPDTWNELLYFHLQSNRGHISVK